jgi:hypothetical protein
MFNVIRVLTLTFNVIRVLNVMTYVSYFSLCGNYKVN